MNDNPWNVSDAFYPMFTDVVVVVGNRKEENASRQMTCNCKAMVVDDGLDMTDGEIQTDVYMWVVTIPKCNWTDVTKPQQGDEIKFVNSEQVSFKVSRVVVADDTYRLFCRSR